MTSRASGAESARGDWCGGGNCEFAHGRAPALANFTTRRRQDRDEVVVLRFLTRTTILPRQLLVFFRALLKTIDSDRQPYM